MARAQTSTPHGTGGRTAPIDAVSRGSGRSWSQLRQAPALTLAAIKLVRRAAPRQAAITTALQIVNAGLIGLQLLLIKGLVSDLVRLDGAGGGNAWSLVPVLAALVGANAAYGLGNAALAHQQRLMGDLVGHHTMDGIINVASTVGLSSYEDPVFHDHLERARAAALSRPMELVTSVTMLLTAALTSVAIGVALLTLEPVLLPLVVLAGAPFLVAALHNSRHAYAFEYSMTVHAREHLHLMEVLTGQEFAKELRTTSATDYLRRRYDALTHQRLKRLRAFLRRRLLVSLSATLATGFGTAIALGSLVWLLTSGRTDVATAGTAALAMHLLSSRLLAINTSIGKIVEAGMFLDDYQSFLRMDASQRSSTGVQAEVAPAGKGFDGASVERVSFWYPGTDRQVLDDVSIEIGRGEVVALVGENGSGKTTLVKLLCRLYSDLQAGRILWNGADISTVDPHVVREQITVLFQDFARYELTVAENIVLGRPEAAWEDDRIRTAAGRAGAEEMIERLPHGYATRLGRRFYGGEDLSGGQWQRLALARAFYRDGELLILDEPAAALDPRAEYELFEQVTELAANKSVLLISHRFSNVRMADRIYVLQDGRVVEQGTHDELKRLDGLYAELYNLQATAYFGDDDQPA